MTRPLRAFARAAAAALAAAASLTALPGQAHAADPAHDPTVTCGAYWRYTGVLVFGGTATIPASHAPRVRSLTVTCTYWNEAGAYMSTNTAPAPAVATAGAGLLGAGSMRFCGYAEVVYEDGHRATVTTPCTSQSVLPV
ncbi:MAG TPA: hypothetical protein VNA20_00380 [Frankiaceae bacterium]|nr:hypothetical protein [Frankiaceae bacterium]